VFGVGVLLDAVPQLLDILVELSLVLLLDVLLVELLAVGGVSLGTRARRENGFRHTHVYRLRLVLHLLYLLVEHGYVVFLRTTHVLTLLHLQTRLIYQRIQHIRHLLYILAFLKWSQYVLNVLFIYFFQDVFISLIF